MHRPVLLFVWVTMIFSASSQVDARRLKTMDLELSRDAENRLDGPIYDTSESASLRILPLVAAYDRDAEVVRSLGFGTKPWNLDRSIDLASLLTTELVSAATAMGFSTTAASGRSWTVGGRLTDVFVESKAGFWGGMQHYGYVELELAVTSPDGTESSGRVRIHEFIVNANAGMSQKDEAIDAVARLLTHAGRRTNAPSRNDFATSPPGPLSDSGRLRRG
jgi:hypothetical protein